MTWGCNQDDFCALAGLSLEHLAAKKKLMQTKYTFKMQNFELILS